MTEREKMLGGFPYDSRDSELIKQYHKARKLMQAYNALDSEDLENRNALLKDLLAKVGEGVWIEPPFLCDYGNLIQIGAGTFVNANCIFLDNNHIRIGKNGLIGPHVQLYTASHPLRANERLVTQNGQTRYQTFSKPITIGDNVWIGGNTVVLPGVCIGHNVTIGAGSVVTKDIPDNVLAFGNPCKPVREL